MAIKLSVGIKYSDFSESMGLGPLTPMMAYRAVRDLSKLSGFEYADVLPIVDGESLMVSRFVVVAGDNVAEKFAGYYRKED